jgi:hypothetical protein
MSGVRASRITVAWKNILVNTYYGVVLDSNENGSTFERSFRNEARAKAVATALGSESSRARGALQTLRQITVGDGRRYSFSWLVGLLSVAAGITFPPEWVSANLPATAKCAHQSAISLADILAIK